MFNIYELKWLLKAKHFMYHKYNYIISNYFLHNWSHFILGGLEYYVQLQLNIEVGYGTG